MHNKILAVAVLAALSAGVAHDAQAGQSEGARPMTSATQEGGAPQDLFRQLDDTRFNLLVFGQAVPDALPLGRELLRVHSFLADEHNVRELARARVPQTSFWLLRPDGHIGLAGTKLDAADVHAYCAAIHLRHTNGRRRDDAIEGMALSTR